MRLMILVLSLILGLLPLAAIGWIFANGMLTIWPPSASVDGLFMTLILLTISLCLLLNAFWEARDQGLLPQKREAATATAKPAAPAVAAQAAKTPPVAKVSS